MGVSMGGWLNEWLNSFMDQCIHKVLNYIIKKGMDGWMVG